MPDTFWVIVHNDGRRLWGEDGWVIPPGKVVLYETREEARKALVGMLDCKAVEYHRREN